MLNVDAECVPGANPDTSVLCEPQPTTSIKKGSFRRSERGKLVINSLAIWIAERLQASGLTFDQWLERGCQLSEIGVTRATAASELKPRIPDAHEWYNASGDGKTYPTWEAYWNGSLCNRAIYFFRRHKPEGGIVAALAEWPSELVDGVLIPPTIEREANQ
jgi:hypothetical protein